MLSSPLAGLPTLALDHRRKQEWPTVADLREQTLRAKNRLRCRLHFGMVAGIKSTSGRDQVGIGGRIESEIAGPANGLHDAENSTVFDSPDQKYAIDSLPRCLHNAHAWSFTVFNEISPDQVMPEID